MILQVARNLFPSLHILDLKKKVKEKNIVALVLWDYERYEKKQQNSCCGRSLTPILHIT